MVCIVLGDSILSHSGGWGTGDSRPLVRDV